MTVHGSRAAIPAGDDVWDDEAEWAFRRALPLILAEVLDADGSADLAERACRGLEELIAGIDAAVEGFPPPRASDMVFPDEPPPAAPDTVIWSIGWLADRVRVAAPLVARGELLGELVMTAAPGRWVRRQEREQLRAYADLVAPALVAALQVEALRGAALTDDLTGLANRRALDHELDGLCMANRPLRLLLLDVDRLKLVNDTLGYDQGDHLIVTLAEAVREAVGDEHLVARLGGDEFVVVLPGAGKKQARELERRIREAFECKPLPPGVAAIGRGVSIGIVKARPGEGPRGLVRRAARSMRGQKRRRSGDT